MARPNRLELILALQAAELLLHRIGSDHEDVPAHVRLPALKLEHRLARLLRRCDLPPPALRKRDMLLARDKPAAPG